jgi:hypothetical protein
MENANLCGDFQPSKKPTNGAHLYKHGMMKHPLYSQWRGMMQRCQDPNQKQYKYYGGKGIKVCDRWHDFPSYLADMGMPLEGQTIDRIDSNKDYCPENCRWVSRSEQMKNRSNAVLITFNGTTKNLIDWARSIGINKSTLKYRLRNWPMEKALAHTRFKTNGEAI